MCVRKMRGGASKTMVANNDLLIKAKPRRISDEDRLSRDEVTRRAGKRVI